MSRTARVAFLLLVAASFGAFFAAQRLKNEPSAIQRFDVVKYFSPNGDGERDVQRIVFRLKEADDVTVDVVDAGGGRVARLAVARPARAYRPIELEWRGRTDEGARAPDGTYKVRIGLRRQGRSVVAPFAFFLDTRPPAPAVIATDPPVATPGEPVRVRIRGAGRRSVPRFRVLDTTQDPPRTVAEFDGRRGRRAAVWDGRDARGEPAAPGTYLIAVGARDRAGNFGWGPRLPPQPGTVEGRPGVTVRGLAIQPPTGPVRAGQFVTFRVDAQRRPWRWQIRRVGERPRKRAREPKTSTSLTVRAPGGVSGLYLFEARAGRHTAQVPFAVQAEERSPLLVVLPMITWLGTDPADDLRRPDGIPNTLARGQLVRFPRPFASGLPAGVRDEVAPLLVTLDRARIRYDLTTDLALSSGRDPRPTDRPGVLFAGSHRWVTRSLARRLRRYVATGGRVALFGTGQLRGGVRLGNGRLYRATPPGPADAFGQRLADVRRLADGPDGAPERLDTLTDDPEDLQVLTGFDGRLDHPFPSVEEMVAAGSRAEVVAALGDAVSEEEAAELEAAERPVPEQRPAFTAVKLGKGYVFRTGIPGWVPRLAAGDPEVFQLTRNVIDLLRRVNPRPRSPVR